MQYKSFLLLLLIISVSYSQQYNWKKVFQNFDTQNPKFQEYWNIGNYNTNQICQQGPNKLMKIAPNDFIYTQQILPDHKNIKIQFDLYSINSQELELQNQYNQIDLLDHFYVFIDKLRNMEIKRENLYQRTKNHECSENTYITRKKTIEYIFQHSSRYIEIDFGNIISQEIPNNQFYWGITNLNLYIDQDVTEELLDGDSTQNFFQLWQKTQKQSRRQLISSSVQNSHSGSDSNGNGTTSSSNEDSQGNRWVRHHSSNEKSSHSDSNNDGTTDSSGPGDISSNENSSGSDSNGDGLTDSSGEESSHEISSDSDSNGDGNTDSSNEGRSSDHFSSNEASSGSDSNGDGNSDSSIDLGSNSSGEDSSGSDSNHDGNTDSSNFQGSSGENSSGSDENGDGNTDSSGINGSSQEDSSGSDSNHDGNTDSSGIGPQSSGEASSGSDSDKDGNTDSSNELSSFSTESNSDSNHDGDTDSSQGQGSSQELSSGSDSDNDGDTDSSGIDGVSSGEISNTHSGSDSNGDGDTDSSDGPSGNSSGEISSGSDTNGDGNTDTSAGAGSSGELSSNSDSDLDGFTDSSGEFSSGEIEIECPEDQIEYGDVCYTEEGLQSCFNYLYLLDNTVEGNDSIANNCTAHQINGEYTYTFHVNYTSPYYHNETCVQQKISFEGIELPEGDASLNYDEWTFNPVNQHIKFQIKHSDLVNKYQCTYKPVVKDGKELYAWICDMELALYFGGVKQLTYSFKMCAFLDRIVKDNLLVQVYKNSVIGGCCENRLGVESTLKFCTDKHCTEYIDTTTNPYTIERLDIVTVEHSITTNEFQDYYLWAQQIRFGPFVPDVVYYDGSQQSRNIIQFVANIAVDSMQIEVISLLNEYQTNGISNSNTMPQSRRNLVTPMQKKKVGNDYKIKGVEFINVQDPAFDERIQLKQEQQKSEQQIEQNHVLTTVLIIVGVIVLISVIGALIYCKYLFNSKKSKQLQSNQEKQQLNINNKNKNNKNDNISDGSKDDDLSIQTVSQKNKKYQRQRQQSASIQSNDICISIQ